MDFGSSHIFTQADSDTEELTLADFNSGIYQPLGSDISAQRSGPGSFSQHEVIYDNAIPSNDGPRPQSTWSTVEPVYDNRGLEETKRRNAGPKPNNGDYAEAYDMLSRQSHPYEYAGIGSGVIRGDEPPPLPPFRKPEQGGHDNMDEGAYAELGGEYMTLLRKGSSKLRRADTNIVAVKFDTLVQSENSERGSPVFCTNCGAAMSSLSKVSQAYSGKCWTCEFCEHENPVSDNLAAPKGEDVTYKVGEGSGGAADTIVIFCVDVSGSMAVTSEVSGEVKHKLDDEQVALQAYQEELEAVDRQRRQAQDAALQAEIVATLQGTVDDQAQALARFQLSRSGSSAVTPVQPQNTPQQPPNIPQRPQHTPSAQNTQPSQSQLRQSINTPASEGIYSESPLYQALPLVQGTPSLGQGAPPMYQATPPLYQATPPIYQATPPVYQAAPQLYLGTVPPAVQTGVSPSTQNQGVSPQYQLAPGTAGTPAQPQLVTPLMPQSIVVASAPIPTLPPRSNLVDFNSQPNVPPPPAGHTFSTVGTSGQGVRGQSTRGQMSQRSPNLEERYVESPSRPVSVLDAPASQPPPPQVAPTQQIAATPQPVASQIMATEPRKVVSYVSRLQSMQSAIEQQVTKLEQEKGLTRVGLVAFNNDVTIIGDGTEDPIPLEGAGLTDKDSLISLVQMFPLPRPVAEVRQCLSEKIFGLKERGQTSLGPALLISISMAAQRPGSKVIMCTDGMANVGLGALNDMENDAAYDQAANFYEDVANFARDSGVCVSVLTLEGEDCRAIELGQVADKTRGQVSIVKPDDLNQQFADILADPVLATNVSAKMVLHKGLFFRDSESDGGESQGTHNVGIVTADSETTFEFGVRKKEVIYDNFGGTTVTVRTEEEPVYESVGATMIDGLERLPFQVQISYTGRDGRDYLRILTMERPVTKDRKFAEQNANVGVIGAHAAQSAAKLAVDGHYAQAHINAIITQKLVQRCTKPEGGAEQEGIYQTFLANMAPIQSEISRAQQKTRRNNNNTNKNLAFAQGGQPPSEAEDAENEDAPLVEGKKKMSKKMKQRRKQVSDQQASVFYRMKGATTKMFNKQTYSFAEVV